MVPEAAIFERGDFIAISDCTQADILEVGAVTLTSGSPDRLAIANCTTCTRPFQTNAVVMRVDRKRFFIRDGTSGQPGLHVQVNGGREDELIEGVENLQILFGQDIETDGTADRYVIPAVIDAACTLATNSCWNLVASVRVSLLLRTLEDNVAQKAQAYSFDGATATAADRRLRREFITVVSLRNHRV